MNHIHPVELIDKGFKIARPLEHEIRCRGIVSFKNKPDNTLQC